MKLNDTIAGSRIGIVGLGYVGLPLACLFATRYDVTGYDRDASRIDELLAGRDRTGEVEAQRLEALLRAGRLRLTADAAALAECHYIIVAVPTPVDRHNHPDLSPLRDATRTVGQQLRRGATVVFESTVYPGVTEEECVPLLEATSGLRYNEDFTVGYSPERVNPGDAAHPVEQICKVTSGSTPEAAERIDALYGSVLQGGTHRAPSIRVAEAAKIAENCQRDVNIAFVNELAKICNAMGIDTGAVLEAAATKWNFIAMRPGLVGGHCIGVDPYYLIEKAKVYGVMPRLMSDARRLNDGMGDYVAQQLVHLMNLAGRPLRGARILVLGFAFKEDCADTRNTKVADIVRLLASYHAEVTVVDPWVDAERVQREYGIVPRAALDATEAPFDAAILAVAHSQFKALRIRDYVPRPGVVYDVKGVLPPEEVDARL